MNKVSQINHEKKNPEKKALLGKITYLVGVEKES